MKINYKKVERVNSYGSDTNKNIDSPGYYKIPVRNYCSSVECKWLQREVLKVSHNFGSTLIITQNPRKKSDIKMYYYNGSEELFKPMEDMEFRKYRKSVWYDEWHNCTKESEEFFSFWCEIFDNYNPHVDDDSEEE